MFRVGIGYDAHRLTKGRALILGGVKIPYTHGLEGHSDADVLIHALIDALIGALGKGDIGRHFPDTDPSLEGVSSLAMLRDCSTWIKEEGFGVNNVDATIVAQRPKLESYLSEMEEKIAALLEVPPDFVNIKATTTEGLGFCGRVEGMEAFAVVSLAKT